jgi:hypothetical protein
MECHGNDISNFSLSSFSDYSDYFFPFLMCDGLILSLDPNAGIERLESSYLREDQSPRLDPRMPQ